MSDTCGIDDARVILPDLIEQVRALGRPVVLTDGDGEGEPLAALVPAGWLDAVAGGGPEALAPGPPRGPR